LHERRDTKKKTLWLTNQSCGGGWPSTSNSNRKFKTKKKREGGKVEDRNRCPEAPLPPWEEGGTGGGKLKKNQWGEKKRGIQKPQPKDTKKKKKKKIEKRGGGSRVKSLVTLSRQRNEDARYRKKETREQKTW